MHFIQHSVSTGLAQPCRGSLCYPVPDRALSWAFFVLSLFMLSTDHCVAGSQAARLHDNARWRILEKKLIVLSGYLKPTSNTTLITVSILITSYSSNFGNHPPINLASSLFVLHFLPTSFSLPPLSCPVLNIIFIVSGFLRSSSTLI